MLAASLKKSEIVLHNYFVKLDPTGSLRMIWTAIIVVFNTVFTQINLAATGERCNE